MLTPIKLLSLSILTALSLLWATPALTAEAAPAGQAEPASAPTLVAPVPVKLPEAVTPSQSPASTATAPAPEVQVRIGYVDLNRIGKESKPGKEVQSRFKDKADKYQSKFASRQKQLEKQKAALQSSLPSLSPEQRSTRIKSYEKKVEEFKKAVQDAEKEMQPLQEELFDSLSRKIEQAASTHGKANGLAAVLVKKDMLFQGEGVTMVDVTDDVIKLLDAETIK